MILGVFVLGNELAEDHQNAVVSIAQFAKVFFLMLVKRSHGVGVDQ